MRLRLIILFLVIMATASVQAIAFAQVQNFSSAVHDFPLMPGLLEMDDETAVFDKPEGRIVEFTVSLETHAPDEVKKYYAEVLPELGWQVVSGLEFAREGERLEMSFYVAEGRNFMTVVLAPQDAR